MAEYQDEYDGAFTAYKQLRERVNKHLKSLKDSKEGEENDSNQTKRGRWCEEWNTLQRCLEAETEKVFCSTLSQFIFKCLISIVIFYLLSDSANVHLLRIT